MRVRICRYFIAIVLPPPLFDEANELRLYFKDHYNSKASLNSPPHITLHMPFEWKEEKEEELEEKLRTLSQKLSPVKIDLKNFGCFVPRVIFMSVLPGKELNELQSTVRKFCKRELGLFNADYKDLPFHPHVTLAFRDLKKPQFVNAWEEFKNKEFDGSFTGDRICLLKHSGKNWKVLTEFSFRD